MTTSGTIRRASSTASPCAIGTRTTFTLPDNGRKRLSMPAATVAAGQPMIAHWLASR
jgi:hypothetical protein